MLLLVCAVAVGSGGGHLFLLGVVSFAAVVLRLSVGFAVLLSAVYLLFIVKN